MDLSTGYIPDFLKDSLTRANVTVWSIAVLQIKMIPITLEESVQRWQHQVVEEDVWYVVVNQ